MTTETALRIDPEFASLIPPLTREELAQLEANIVAEGCRDPLVVWGPEGILLDGHNRYRVCQEHSIEFDVREIFLADRDAAKIWIIRNQFGRRNLAPYQRAELALKMAEVVSAKALTRKAEQMQMLNEAKTREWLRSTSPEANAVLDALGDQPRRVNAKPSRIYVAVDHKEGRAKIGCSSDTESRLKDIRRHVAVQMNRLFVGIDSDPDAVATTLRRLAEVAGA